MSQLYAGFAEVDYTPELGLKLRGQQYTRIAERVRDPLMANAVAMRRGDEAVVIVSVDICFMPTQFVSEIQRLFERRTGISGDRLLIHATHSHAAPAAVAYYWAEPDPAFMEKLRDDILTAAASAVDRMEPAEAFSGAHQIDCLNWNRRSMFADGTSAMHGSADRPDFIGTEGFRDPNVSVLFFRNPSRKILGVVPNFGTHPNCVDNECYYSADLVGEVRRLLKVMLDSHTVVVYLTGAAGNTTPVMREPGRKEQPWMGETGLLRAGMRLAGEIGSIIAEAVEPIADPILAVRHNHLRIPIRPFGNSGDRCYPSYWSVESKAYYQALEEDWPRRLREESPVEVRISVVRVGDTVICTNPAELFSEFALAIREAAQSRVTIISQLTDGYVGYIPTPTAFQRGGYETWPSGTSQLVPEAGDRIVEATASLLAEISGMGSESRS